VEIEMVISYLAISWLGRGWLLVLL